MKIEKKTSNFAFFLNTHKFTLSLTHSFKTHEQAHIQIETSRKYV